MYIKTSWMKNLEKLLSAGVVRNILLCGAPGSSKTSFAEQYAKENELELFELNITSGMYPEEMLYDLTIEGDQAHRSWSPMWRAFEASSDKKVVLILDEIDKGKERVEDLLLRGLETFRLRTYDKEINANKDNILIFSTSNNNRSLNDATMRRFDVRIATDFPPENIQKDIIRSMIKVDIPDHILDRAIKILFDLSTALRSPDSLGPSKAPSYKELANILDISYTLFTGGVDQKEAEEICTPLLSKDFFNEELKLPFRYMAALYRKYEEGTPK